MKRFRYILRGIFAVILINLTTNVQAQISSRDFSSEISEKNARVNELATAWLDSVNISLLTCGPGNEVWSYYGHTALLIEDKAHYCDIVVNWGMFSFQQDYFILRFVFGLTDYQMGIVSMTDFMTEYAHEGRWVRQQLLLLSREEKLAIMRSIEKNYEPENSTYRYNFFYDNCTTRARNIILDNMEKGSVSLPKLSFSTTYRDEIHKWNADHCWARFGNDLLLGYEADRRIDSKQYEFLPVNLSKDFDITSRTFVNKQGTPNMMKSVLVDSSFYLIPPQAAVAQPESITPFTVFLGLAAIILLLCGMEIYKKKNFWWMDAALFILTGLPGLILLTMIFSQHPTVQVNFQLLILNPLNLFFVWKTSKKLKKGKIYWYYNVWGALLLLSLFMQIWQHYAEGIEILALSLLFRYCVVSIRHDLSKRIKKWK